MGRESHVRRVAEAGKRVDRVPGLQVPELYRPIATRRGDPPAPGIERHTVATRLVPLEWPNLAALEIPEIDPRAGGPGPAEEPLAVRREGQAADRPLSAETLRTPPP